MAGRQPRYEISSGVPGGVMPRGIMEVADAATSFTDFIAKKAEGYAVDLGVPVARAEGAKAGAEVGWAPKPTIGEVGKAYEESALRTHDFTIEREFESIYKTAYTELKDRPNGMNQLNWDERTKPLVAAVSPERQDAAKRLSETYRRQAYLQLLAADTENMEKLEDGRRAALIQTHTDAMFNATFRGDSEGVRFNKTKIDSLWMDRFGKPYVADATAPNGKRFLTFEEFANIDYDEQGNRRVDADGNPVDGIKTMGVGFLMNPTADAGDAASYKKKSAASLAQYTVMGGFNRAQKGSDGGVSYLAEFTENMDSFTDLEPDDRIQLQKYMTGEIRRGLRASSADERQQEKDRKQQIEGDHARVYGDIMAGEEISPVVIERVRSQADMDPDGADKIFAAIASRGTRVSQPDHIANIRNLISLGEYDLATDQIAISARTSALTTGMRDQLEREVQAAQTDAANGPFGTNSPVKAVVDNFEAKVVLAINPQGKNMLTGNMLGGVDDTASKNALVAELRNAISNETRDLPPSQWVKVATDVSNRMLANLSSPPEAMQAVGEAAGWWRKRATIANVLANTPMGSAKYIDESGFFDAHSYKADLAVELERGNISEAEAAERIRLAEFNVEAQKFDPEKARKQEQLRIEVENKKREREVEQAKAREEYRQFLLDSGRSFAKAFKEKNAPR